MLRRLSTKGSLFSAGMAEFMACEAQFNKGITTSLSNKKSYPKVPKPVEPGDGDCCALDCSNCVWIQYQDKLLDYEASCKSNTTDTLSTDETAAAVFFIKPEATVTVVYGATQDTIHPMAGLSIWPDAFQSMNITENRELVTYAAQAPNVALRSTRHIELQPSVPTSYNPADTLSVLLPNDKAVIVQMAKVLNLNLFQNVTIIKKKQKEDAPIVPTKRSSMLFTQQWTIYDLLKWHLDVSSTPRKQVLYSLVPYCTEILDQERMIEWSTVNYDLQVLSKQKSLLDVLQEFPSLEVSFAEILTKFPLLSPRYYTISSFTADAQKSLSITVRCLEEKNERRNYQGLASTYLSTRKISESIVASILPSLFSHIDLTDTSPILMIGPGTGIAPFRSLLSALNKLTPRSIPKTYLFHGCRHVDVDALYTSEMESYMKIGLLSKLFLSASKGVKKEYVQDRIMMEGPLVFQSLVNEKGRILICGGITMGNMVKRVIVTVLMEEGEWKKEKAETFVTKLEKEGRYVAEVWGSG